MPDEFLSITQLAARLGVRERVISRYVDAGTIPHRWIGKALRFRWREIEEWRAYGASQLPEECGEIISPDDPLSVDVPGDIQERLFEPRDLLRTAEGATCVYIIQSGQYFKIGQTKNFLRRIVHLQTMMPEKPETIHIIPTKHGKHLENKLHRLFATKQVNGEWFKLSATDVKWLRKMNEATLERLPL